MLLSVAAALALAAQPSSPWLDEARVLVEQLRFADAIGRLEVARQVRSLEPEELRQVLELLAYCQIAEGRRDAAEATYTTMLQADPWMQLKSSPKVMEAFEAAKTRLFPADFVRLEQKAAPSGFAAFTLIDPWNQVRAVTLFERRASGEWLERALIEEAGHAYRFASSVTGEEQLEWYVEASTQTSVAAHVASKESPRVSKIARQEPIAVIAPPLPRVMPASRVAGFVVLGLAVAVGAVATGLAVGGTDLRQAARDPSRAQGEFADTARIAEREGQQQQTWALGLFIGAGASVATGVVLVW